MAKAEPPVSGARKRAHEHVQAGNAHEEGAASIERRRQRISEARRHHAQAARPGRAVHGIASRRSRRCGRSCWKKHTRCSTPSIAKTTTRSAARSATSCSRASSWRRSKRRRALHASADSLRDITAKLIRRHPHVFGTAKDVNTPGQVLEQWEQIKAREQKTRGQTQVGAARHAEGAARAARRARDRHARRRGGLRLGEDRGRRRQDRRGGRRARSARSGEGRGAGRGRDGRPALLRSPISRRKLGVEPESALRKANQKFSERFREARTAPRGAGPVGARCEPGRDGRDVAEDRNRAA